MARYSIDGQILTDIGDAIRAKKGENPYHSEGTVKSGTGDWLDNTVKQTYKFTFTTTSIASNDSGTSTGYFFFNSKVISPTYTFTVGETTEGFFTIEDITNKKLLLPLDKGNINGTYVLELADENENVLYSYSPEDMATEIENILAGPSDKELTFGGSCSRLFQSKWDWFIDKYGAEIKCQSVTAADYMFYQSKVQYIPFSIGCYGQVNLSNLFAYMTNLREAPRVTYPTPSNIGNLFSGCNSIRTIPENYFDTWDWSYLNNLTSAYNGEQKGIFNDCFSLRSFPMSIFENGNPTVTYSYTYFNNACFSCSTLDELVNLPNPYTKGTYTSNMFGSFVNSCSRLKNLTFRAMEPVKWKTQTLDLSTFVGYSNGGSTYRAKITGYNSGITADKEVIDDATYQALKNDPDWFTCDIAYSRYNHDSAVATINSLPDTSAYLTSAGGTNTLKFKGAAGSATDGGAINTLTEEEIAVAASRGWTVTLA